MSLARNPNHPQRLTATAAGLLALGLTAVAVYLAFWGVPFTGGYELKAVFEQANNVHTRTPVRVAGVDVGEVTGLERGPGGTAVVTMELRDAGLPVHRDAEVKIRPRIFLEGNFFLDLHPGTPSAPTLEEGETIPLSQTATPVQLDEVLATLNSDTRTNLTRLVDAYRTALEDGGAEALAGASEPARDAFAGGAQLSEAFRGEREGDLAGFVDDGGETAAALSRDERRLAQLVTGLNRTARGLSASRGDLGRSVRELDRVLAQAGPALRELNALFPPARRFVREARPGIREAPETLRLALPFLDQVAGLLRRDELPALRGQLDPALASLASLEPKLVDVLELVTPVTECLRRNALPTLKTPVEDPPLSSGEPVYRELLYGLVGLASASQNFDGNGPALRYHGGFGKQLVTLGRLPHTGEPLFGLGSEPILGSRPKFTGDPPPFRPDVPCVSQDPPDLAAETGPAPEQRVVARASKAGER